jgi:hypothetical protein
MVTPDEASHKQKQKTAFPPPGDWMSLIAPASATAGSKKAGFIKVVDAGVAMGADLQ